MKPAPAPVQPAGPGAGVHWLSCGVPKSNVVEVKLQKSVMALLEGGAFGSWRKVVLE